MKTPRSSVFYYGPWALLVIVVIGWAFREVYWAGKLAGLRTSPPGLAAAAKVVDLRALAMQTDLAAQGQPLFMINCASCHGAKGEGDGDRAASLSPKPRNYRTEKFKFGDDIVSIYTLLLNGSPGTSMPSFQLLPPEDLFAMAHYVRTLIPRPAPTTPELLALLPESRPGGIAAAAGPRIPILLALERMAQTDPDTKIPERTQSATAGGRIFQDRCAACHGGGGQGGRVQVLDTHPYRYAEVAPFYGSKAVWTRDRTRFAERIVNGIPGHSMPGQATLTKAQMNDLFAFALQLTQDPALRQ